MSDGQTQEWTSASDFFSPWESLVTDWNSAVKRIDEVISTATSKRRLAWRGAVNESWPLYSSIYRRVASQGKFQLDSSVVALEERILRNARTKWRFDDKPALEIMAQVQHLGGVTRLLDVTLNPFIALWFAVEEKFDNAGETEPDVDGRLFIFDVTDREIELDDFWRSRDLPWGTKSISRANSSGTNPITDWTSALPRLWRPPSYNERIAAQNAGFLIGGVPIMKAGQNAWYRKAPGNYSKISDTWSAEEVRKTTSVTLRMNRSDSALRAGQQRQSTPTFTLRIQGSAKREIRENLGRRMGLDPWTIYPDLLGLSEIGMNIR
jgi:hypothetical protein